MGWGWVKETLNPLLWLLDDKYVILLVFAFLVHRIISISMELFWSRYVRDKVVLLLIDLNESGTTAGR